MWRFKIIIKNSCKKNLKIEKYMYRHTKVNTILEIISREEKENGEIIR